MRRGILVGLAALLLAGAPALAEERTRSYGGSGADRLTRLIEYGDGLIAVGRTDSRNGDLAMRTRRNQAGWMLCLNGEGAPLWSYCTAKDGRNEMSAPFAHENGQISAVLTGRGIDGLEWLIVSGEGRLAQRRTAPAVETVCAHGGTDMIGMPYDRDGALIHCNPAASELLERSADECVYADLFEPLCPFEKVMAMQRSDFVASELTVGERTVELYFAPFSDEERGKFTQLLESGFADTFRREFVANVSHELRTPLTNIRSYAETIRDAGDELPRELENSFLDIVINESDRMTHIVQDLLTLSRLDSGRSEMNMARFDFGAAIDSVLRSIELEARRHGHELTHDYHDLPMIMGDRGRIDQVMLNVLGNAVKYTPDGGHIRVTGGTVGERVWMEVADDGIGIPKADRSRIFERFYRVDKARSRESGGTGLGLSIATEIVQRHNGTLSLVDREGPGTTVRLELPIRQSEVGGAQEGGNG